MIEPLHSERFQLRCLLPGDDLSRYLEWMRNVQAFPFIESVRIDYSYENLVSYISEINSSNSSLQLSIFDKKSQRHIGNIKFHDINFEYGTCFVGFLIGDVGLQNMGVAREVFICSSAALYRFFGISQYKLGVSPSHTQAISAYSKMGFVESVSYGNFENSGKSILMALVLESKYS